jgi:uncharacterized protein (DUF433 family)
VRGLPARQCGQDARDPGTAKGTRITVGDILQWLSTGMTNQEILEDYPELREVHIRAALSFAAERDAISRVAIYEVTA